MFPDQTVFLEYLQANGLDNGRLMIPGTSATLTKDACTVVHPYPEEQVQAIFTQKRTYLDSYKARQQPIIDAQKASWPRGQVDILTSIHDWFEPLLEQADLTSVGINGRVLIDCDVQQIVLDFHTRHVYAWNNNVDPDLPSGNVDPDLSRGERSDDWDYRFHIDPALLEYCIIHHEEDWINQIFLSCRFEAERKGAYNEYVYNFFKCLTPERLQYAEGYYSEKTAVKQLWESNGYRIQRRCPHLKADLTRFAHIENGILTCTMHGWQFELATGRCLTSEGHPLYAQPIIDAAATNGSVEEVDQESTDGQVQAIRIKCSHCWYNPKDLPETSKTKTG